MRSIEVLKVTAGTGQIFYTKREKNTVVHLLENTECPVTFKYITMTEEEYMSIPRSEKASVFFKTNAALVDAV